MNEQFQRFGDYVDDFRRRMGDTDCTIPVKSIAIWLDDALTNLWQARGLQRLFTYHDTFELASINDDGTSATAFYLDGGKDYDVQASTINEFYLVRLVNGQGCKPCVYNLCYEAPLDFYMENAMPETNTCTPCSFTMDIINGKQKILFDAPVPPKMMLDMVYSASHPKIDPNNANQLIRIPRAYMNVVDLMVQIGYYKEASDIATARALWEDADLGIANIREMLAKQKATLPARTFKGAFHNG